MFSFLNQRQGFDCDFFRRAIASRLRITAILWSGSSPLITMGQSERDLDCRWQRVERYGAGIDVPKLTERLRLCTHADEHRKCERFKKAARSLPCCCPKCAAPNAMKRIRSGRPEPSGCSARLRMSYVTSCSTWSADPGMPPKQQKKSLPFRRSEATPQLQIPPPPIGCSCNQWQRRGNT